MKCVECGQENREQARFCDECGTPLLVRCAACGQANRAAAKFCDGCGAVLSRNEPAPEAGERPPQSYTPRYLAEKILITRGALEGERKLVTVLFADIADSSSLAQQLDAEQLHRLLDQVLQLAAEAVHRYGGTVNSYLGDGLMALFGAPLALEDHTLRAVHAALTIQETIRGYNSVFQREHGVEVRLRIGLNTGSVVVGRIGDDLRMDYTANSNTVHLGSRMQDLAEPGTILVTEEVHQAVAGQVDAELLGPIEIRGWRTPVVVYRVTGRGRWRSRLEMRAERGLTRLVGRRRELAPLHDRLARAEAGHGQAVAIAGEPGLGKSRLLYEFRQSLGEGRANWLEGHCRPHGRAVPYGPILEILRRALRLEEDDSPRQPDERLSEGVRALDPALAETLPFLELLFGQPGADAALRHLDPQAKRQQTHEAIVRVLATAGRQQPLVLVIENLHWRDQSSEDFLAFLAGSLPSLPVLMLTTHRSGYAVRWADMPFFSQIHLDRLVDDEMAEMAAALLGGRASDELLRFVAEKAGGNPLFIEEVVHALVERGFVVREPSRIDLASAAEIELPSTIQGIIEARIDALGDPIKQTVQLAAVVGREFDLRVLARASERPAEVPGHLEKLKRVELIHQTRLLPNLEYGFRHAVIRGVAYRSLLGPRRQALHGAVGRAMEELGLGDQAGILAHHYAESDQQEKAIGYAVLAGDQAARLYAGTEARAYYDEALTLTRSLAPSPELQRAQIDAALKRAGVAAPREALEEDQRNLEQARALAEEQGDEPRLASVLYWLGRLAYARGMFQLATGYAEQSLAIADRLDDEALAAPPVNLMGRRYYLTGEYTRASRLLARNVQQMRGLGNTTEEATAAGFAGVAFGALGDFDRALSYANHGLRLAQELKNPFVEAAAYNYRAVAYCHQGAAAAAIADCEAVRRIAERTGDRFRLYLVQFYEAQAHTMAGDPATARRLIEASIALAKEFGTTTLLAWGQGLLAASLLALGDPDAAEPLCREAIELARRTHDRLAEGLANRTLGEALAARGPADAVGAEAALLEAMRLQREMDCEPELARSRLSYARLLHGAGRSGEAVTHLSQAADTFRRLGMPADLARAEAVRELMPAPVLVGGSP